MIRSDIITMITMIYPRMTGRQLLILAGTAGIFGTLTGEAAATPEKRNEGAKLPKAMIWTSAPEQAKTHFVAFR